MTSTFEHAVFQIDVNYHYSLASYVVLYYDYLLTFNGEVEFFWRRKLNSVTILFFVNRYLSLFGNIPIILQSFRDWSPETCDNLQIYHQLFSLVVQIIVGIILIIRTYALYERRKSILLIMVIFAVGGIVVAVWSLTGKSVATSLPFDISFKLGCHPLISMDAGIRLTIAWIGLLVFDSVIFLLTLYKAVWMWKMGSRRLLHVLIRDGTIYYLVLTISNLSNILTFIYADPVLKGVGTTFANIISVTMVSRLMINLQNPSLFETSGVYTTDANVGPFVTTIVDQCATDISVEYSTGESTRVASWVYQPRSPLQAHFAKQGHGDVREIEQPGVSVDAGTPRAV